MFPVREFLEARGIRWGGRMTRPQPLSQHRLYCTDNRVLQIPSSRAPKVLRSASSKARATRGPRRGPYARRGSFVHRQISGSKALGIAAELP